MIEMYKPRIDRIYKAVDKVDNDWVCGYYVKAGKSSMIYSPVFDRTFIVYPSTVCQQIGVCDSCGTFVYENDIVLMARTDICRVIYSGCKYVLLNADGTKDELIPEHMSALGKVIGNLYNHMVERSE